MTSVTVSSRQRPDHVCIDMPEIFPQVTKEIWGRRQLSVDEKIQALKEVFSKEPAVRGSFKHWMTGRMTFVLSSPLMTDLKRSVSHVAKEFFDDNTSVCDEDMEYFFLLNPYGFADWFKQGPNRCLKAIGAFVEYVELGMFSVYNFSFLDPILLEVETLIEIAQVFPGLIKRLFTVEKETGLIPLFDEIVFEKAIPFFKRLKEINNELLWEIITTVDLKGNTLLHGRSNKYFFPSILSLYTNVTEQFKFLRHSLFALNNKEKTPLDDPLFFSKTFDFLMEFSSENPKEVLTLLSTKMKNGKTVLHHPDNFKNALPLLMKLAEIDHKGVHELLFDETIEDSLVHEDGIFRLAIPLLEKVEMVRNEEDELCNRMMRLIEE